MGLAHPDLVFRIQDSIITERKTLKPKKYLENPKKTQKLKKLSLYYLYLQIVDNLQCAPQRPVILTSVTQAGSA